MVSGSECWNLELMSMVMGGEGRGLYAASSHCEIVGELVSSGAIIRKYDVRSCSEGYIVQVCF